MVETTRSGSVVDGLGGLKIAFQAKQLQIQPIVHSYMTTAKMHKFSRLSAAIWGYFPDILVGISKRGRQAAHAMPESAIMLVHAIHFGCGFICIVMKCVLIGSFRLWSSMLDGGEVQRHPKYHGYRRFGE